MGQSIQELRGIITANISSFERGIQGAIRATQQFRQDFAQAARDVDTAATRITTVVAGISTAVAGMVVKTGVSFDDLKQRTLIAFETMLGSGEKAKDFFDELAKFAATTPFELRGLLKNTQTMMGMGIEAEKIIPMLTAMGDAMSGMGKGAEDLDRLIMSFSQMQARGRITGEELREFAHNGIGALKMLADAAGVTTGEMQKMVEKGLVPADYAIDVLLTGMNAKFGGMMSKMTSTFSGVLSNLKDTFDQTSGYVVEPLFVAVTKGLNSLYQNLQGGRVQAIVETLRTQFQTMATNVEAFLGANMETVVERTAEAFTGLVSTGATFVSWLAAATPAIAEFGSEVWALIQPIMAWLGTHPQVLAWILLLKGAEMSGALDAVGSLGRMLMSLGPAIIGVASAFGPWGIAIAAVAAGIAYLISQTVDLQAAWDSIKTSAPEIWGQIETAVSDVAAELRTALGPAMEDIKAAIIEMLPAVADLAKAFAEAFGALAPMIKDLLPLFTTSMVAPLKAVLWVVTETVKQFTMMAKAARDAVDAVLEFTGVGKDARENRASRERDDARRAALKLRQDPDWLEKKKAMNGEGEDTISDEGADPENGGAGTAPGGEKLPSLNLPEKKRTKKGRYRSDLEINEAADVYDDTFGDMDKDLARMGGGAPTQRIAGLQGQSADLKTSFADGNLTVEELAKAAKDLGQQVKAVEDFEDKIEDLRKKLSPAEAARFGKQFDELLEELQNGNISADGFRRGLGKLNDEMRDAARASDEAARAKDRERLARGDFTNDEVQRAIQDRLIGQQQHLLSQYVDNLLGLNQTTVTATEHLSHFSDGLENVSHTMKSMTGVFNGYLGMLPGTIQGGQSGYAVPGGMLGGDPGDGSMGMIGGGSNLINGGMPTMVNSYNTMLPFGSQAFGAGASAFGQGQWTQPVQQLVNNFKNYITTAANLQNDMAMDQQKLGLGIGMDFNMQVQTQIAQLQAQLQSLKQPAPLFDSSSTDWSSGYAADPGLGSKGATGNIQLNFPNLTRVTNSEVSQLADGLQREMRRRGSPLG